MITILFSRPKFFAAGPVRKLLEQHVPLYKWTCGEDDDGSDACACPLARPVLITGRSGATTIFVEVREDHAPEDGLPVHAQKIRIARPTVDHDTLAERIACVVASTFAFVDRDAVRVRFEGSDAWLDIDEVVKLTELVLGGEPIAGIIGAFGKPAEALAAPSPGASPDPAPTDAPPSSGAREPAPGLGGRSNLARMPYDDRPPFERGQILGCNLLGLASSERSMLLTLAGQAQSLGALYDMSALPAFHSEQPRIDRLPTLALLFEERPAIDLAELQRGFAAIDAEGGWAAREEGGDLVFEGRGTSVRLAFSPHPLPPFMVELALHRSLGASAGEPMRRLRRHRAHASLVAEVDPTAASWLDVRETAKIMLMAIALAHRPTDGRGRLAGVFNAATESLFTDDMIPDLVGALAQGEVSIKTFVYHAFRSLEPGKICITSAGMLPFVGREIEIWDAPGDIEFVGDRLNKIERYLLIEGPVVGDGDTIGDTPGEPWARLWHGTSDDTTRAAPVPVYKAEICGPGGRWRPRHDPPRADPPLGSGGIARQPEPEPAAAPRAPAFAGFGRRTGGFGRRGA